MKRVLTLTLFCLASPCHGAVERIVESFDGTGKFDSAESVVTGLDNPGWFISGNGTLESGGYSFMNLPGFDESENDEAERIILGRGSFVSRMEVRNLDLGELGEDSNASSWIRLRHIFGELPERELLNMGLAESGQTDSSHWILFMRAGAGPIVNEIVPRGNHLAMQVEFEASASVATFSYDNDVDDANPGLSFELEYIGPLHDSHIMSMTFAAFDNIKNSGILDSYSLIPISNIQGDFNANDVLDAEDIDLLSEAVRAGTNGTVFDLNDDKIVDQADRTILVHELKNTFFGDANLNGEFNSADLVNVFQSAEFEDNVPLNSIWLTGDWNGDGEFNSGDLVMAFQDGGYEAGPRAAVTAVPEPTSVFWLLLFSALLAHSRQVRARLGGSC